MARCFVGLPEVRGKLERYAAQYDLAEIRPVDTPIPGPAGLERWRASVPPAFAFAVVLPRVVGELREGEELERALATSLDAARALQARCILLVTPPSVRPTRANRDRIAALAARLPQHGHVVGWEPSGIWELGDVAATSERAGVLAVLDAARDPLPPGPIAYTRIRSIGQAAELSAAAVARIADQLRGRREAFVVAEGGAPKRLRAALADAMANREPRRAAPMLLRPGHPAILAADDEEQ